MKSAIGCVLFFLTSLGVRAEAPGVLTWSDAVASMRENNADLRAAEASLRSTRELEGVARSGFLPEVTGTLNYSRGDDVNAATRPVDEHDGVYSGTLNASQNLFAGFQDVGKLRQASANTESAAANLQLVRARVGYDLVNAFEGVVYARGYGRLTEEIIRRRGENLRLVQLRFQSGRENEGSVLLSRAYLEQAKYDDLQAKNAFRVARAQLMRALGIDDGDLRDVSGDVPVSEPKGTPSMKALAQETPDYIQALAQERAQQAAVTVARSGFYPTLAMAGKVGETGHAPFAEDRDQWSVGVNLTLPIFNGGSDFYGTRSAAAEAARAEAARINVGRQVLAKLEQTYAAYIEAVTKLRVDESFRNAAQLRAEIARKKYNNGLLTFDDWDVIENDLINREKAYQQSRRDRVLAEAAWQQALGKGVIP
jgi:outer membrane protein TolC